MFILAILVSAWIAGGLLSFLLFSIISVYLAIYFCYNYIEPHFNSRIGVEREKRLSRITKDPNHLAMGDIGRLFHGYGKSKAKQLWDLSGEGSLKGIFEIDPENTLTNPEFIGASDKKWISWLIIFSFFVFWWVALQIGALIIFLPLYLVGISEGLAISVSGLLSYIILIPLTLLFIYIDGSLDRIKEMLRFGSVKRTLILILAIPIVVTIIDWILTFIYTVLWIGIFGEPSINTDMGTYWESSSIDIALLFLLVAIVAPIVEELMFRGYILDAINRKHSDWTAIIWSSILFGFLHFLGGPFYIGSTFIGGIIYGWIRVRTGSLLPSIAGHMMWNIMALSLTYL
jgi:membrane protease YdiL (CAAX protease family)